MWVVLLDGVGVLCVSAAGRVALRGRPAKSCPYPVLGRRTDATAAPKTPIGGGGQLPKKLSSLAFTARIRRCTGIGLDGLVPVDRCYAYTTLAANLAR